MSLPLPRLIEERALELGFLSAGIVPAGPLDHAPHLDQWLADGFHGSMHWMENHRPLRVDPTLLEPGTRSIIAVAAPYFHESAEPDASGISLYARGDDYHPVLRQRLSQLAAFIAAETGRDIAARPVTDSAPLLERNVAIKAGLGWLGKSAMVLHQQHGSWFFLAELLVDMPLEALGAPHPDRCGTCTRCLDLCPTGAIVAPFRVDARRCISYLTIELRGPIPRQLRTGIGTHLFGCDICQSVCPWNQRAAPPGMEAFSPRPEVISTNARELLTLSPEDFNRRFRNSPIKRTKRRGMARNAAVVLGNQADPDSIKDLAQALLDHDEPLARGHAAWALGRFESPDARSPLDVALRREHNDWVREEIRHALDQHHPTA